MGDPGSACKFCGLREYADGYHKEDCPVAIVEKAERVVIDAAIIHVGSWVEGHELELTESRCPACLNKRAFHKATSDLIAARKKLNV